MVKNLKYVDIDYCRFSAFGYRKPTRFWVPEAVARAFSNILCDGHCKNMVEEENGRRHHRLQLGGHNRGTREEAYRIPEAVVKYLCGHVAPSGFRPIASPFNDSPAPPSSIEPNPQTDASEPPIRVHKVTVRSWHHRPNRPFQVGRMEHRGGSYQLMLAVDIEK